MSIGPLPKEEEIGLGKIREAKYAAKKTVAAFFEQPVHYLFYFTLTSVIGCLLFHVRIAWELYVILAFLGSDKAIRYVFKNQRSN